MTRDGERGAAVVELALLGALLLALATALLPTLQTVLAYNELSRATAEALRFAVHAEANPRPGTHDCPALTRWPSSEEVREHIESSLGHPLDAFVLAPKSPCLIRFDEDRRVTVTASVNRTLGLDLSVVLTVTQAGLKE